MSVIIGEPITTSEPGAWLSIQDAARHLSVSERTIYRKADQGKLRRRSRPDGRVEVFVPMTAPSDTSDESSDFGSQPSALLLVEHLTHALTRQAEAFNAELRASRQQLVDQAEIIGMLRAQISTLEAHTAPQTVEPTAEALAARPAPTMWLTPRRFWSIAAILLVLVGVGVVQVTVLLFSLAVQLAMPQ